MKHAKPTRQSRPWAYGFTLLEAVLSLVLLSIVMVAVGSAMVFASAATPDEDSAVAQALDEHRLLARIADDLSQAMYVTEQSSTAITVVVPDRTGDDIPDRIGYAWAGAGEPLTYTVNDAAAAVVADSVSSFTVAADLVSVVEDVPGPLIYGSVEQLDSFADLLLPSSLTVTQTQWYGQVATPTLDSEAVGFVPTQAGVYAGKTNPADGQFAVEFRGVVGGVADDTVYAAATVDEGTLADGMSWYPVELPDAPVFGAGSSVAIVCRYLSGTSSVAQLYSNTRSGGGLISSSDSGGNWSQSSNDALCYRLYGRQVYQDDGYQVTRQRYRSVQVTLSRGGDASARRRINMLQRPEQLDAFWAADFETDPTAMDLDGNGTADWDLNSSFDPEDVANGTWTIRTPCTAASAGQFKGVVTIEARLRSTSGDGPGIYGPFSATGTSLLPMVTQLRQDGVGGQELVFYNEVDPTTPLARVEELPQGWIDLRLLVLTDHDVVMVEVNGKNYGSIQLSRISDSGTPRTVSVRAIGDDAEVDYIRAGVGGSAEEVSEDDEGVIGSTLNLLRL